MTLRRRCIDVDYDVKTQKRRRNNVVLTSWGMSCTNWGVNTTYTQHVFLFMDVFFIRVPSDICSIKQESTVLFIALSLSRGTS